MYLGFLFLVVKVMHAYDSSSWETQPGGSGVQSQPWSTERDPVSKVKQLTDQLTNQPTN